MKTVTLTIANNHQTVELPVDSELVVMLPEEPTTGYLWTIDDENNVLSPIDTQYTQYKGAGIGGGGMRFFRIQALPVGTTLLRIKHWREWQGDELIIGRFDVTLEVR